MDKPKNNNSKKIFIIVVLCFLPVLAFFIGYWQKYGRASAPISTDNYISMPIMLVADLAAFDGTDANKPIYIGMNGLVYDVSAGRKFYETGASYHYLAGKDSSTDLNMIGGDIIARKYPVIARFVN